MVNEIRVTKAKFEAGWPRVVEGIANDLVNSLVRRCPVDQGTLKNSIRYNVDSSSKITISMLEYALYVEFGTAPHIIRPKDAKALHWKSGGKDVFASIVHHPGTRPQPFIRTTLRVDMARIIKQNILTHLS